MTHAWMTAGSWFLSLTLFTLIGCAPRCPQQVDVVWWPVGLVLEDAGDATAPHDAPWTPTATPPPTRTPRPPVDPELRRVETYLDSAIGQLELMEDHDLCKVASIPMEQVRACLGLDQARTAREILRDVEWRAAGHHSPRRR